MEDVPVKCFICCTNTEEQNSKTIDLSSKIVDNCLTFLHSAITDDWTKSNGSYSQNYVTFCKECFACAENLTQLKEQKVELKEQKTHLQERQTQLQEQQTQLQNQQTQLQARLKHAQKEMTDSSIEFSLSVLHRRSQNKSEENQQQNLTKQTTQLNVTDLPEITDTTPNVEIEKNNGGIRTVKGSTYSTNSNNKIIEADVPGLPPVLFPIQALQSVSDQSQIEDGILPMPFLDVQCVHERDIEMQESIPKERGVVNKNYTKQRVERGKCVIDVSKLEAQEDNLSVGCGGAEKAGSKVQPNLNNKIIEADVPGLPPLLIPIQVLQSVSDQSQLEDRIPQMPLLDVQNVPERDIEMQESNPEERGGVDKNCTEQGVETGKVAIDFCCGETKKDIFSVGCDGANKEGQEVETNKGIVELVGWAEPQRSSQFKIGSQPVQTVHAGNVKLKNLTEGLNLVKAMLDHLERYPFKCNHCEERFTSLNKLQSHLQFCTEETSNGERRNPHKLPQCRITRTHLQNSLLPFDLDKVDVSHKPRHKDEVTSDKNTFKCGDCNKVFSSSNNLLGHKRVHNDKLSKILLQEK